MGPYDHSGDAKAFWQKAFAQDELAQQGPRVRDFLEEVARTADARETRVELVPAARQAEIHGSLGGITFRIAVSYAGAVDAFELHTGATEMPFELEYDPGFEKPSPSARLDTWAASEKRHVLAPGVSIAGTSADAQLEAFRQLPDPLQRRVLSEMRRSRIRAFRSLREEHHNTLCDTLSQHPDPVQLLVSVLQLSVEVAHARGSAMSGNPARS